MIVDVSKWNGAIDWQAAKGAGIDGAVIRCGYGQNQSSQHDAYFKRNVRGCVQNNIPWGVYIYSYADTIEKAKGEAAHALAMIEACGHAPNWPVFIDLEESGLQDFAETAARYFIAEIEEAGCTAGIYASYSWWAGVLKNYKNNENICRWVARWSDAKPNFADLWQYTASAKVDGINGRVDANRIVIGNHLTKKTDANENVSRIGKVQKWLNAEYSQNLGIDGIYGSKTKKALVKALQTELNEQFDRALSVDGIFGTRTYNACVNVKRGASGNITKTLQGALWCHGYEQNEFKAFYGNGTILDVQHFQRDARLSVDGIAGKNTFRSLLK